MWWFAAGTITGVFLFGKYPGAWWLAGFALALVRPLQCPRAVIALALFALGAVHGGLATDRALDRRLPDAQADRIFTLRGRIAGLPEQRALPSRAGEEQLALTRFPLELEGRVPGWPAGRRVMLSHSGAGLDVALGDRLTVSARLRPPRGLVNEAGLDSERLAFARGIDAYGRVEGVLEHGARSGWLDVARAEVARRAGEAVGGEASAILPALVAGDRRGLTAAHWDVLQRTGTAHLVAVSGLHISLVAGAVWLLAQWCLAPLLLPWPHAPTPRTLAIPPALLAAAGYAALAGFALPTQRALLMAVWVMLALGAGHRAAPGAVIALVLAVMLLCDPLAALESGFWLSFLAVVVLAGLLQGRLTLVQGQLLLSLVTGVLAGWAFGVWSLWSAAVNLIMVPLYTLAIIPLALAGALLAPLEPLLALAGWLVNVSWDGTRSLLDWPLLPSVPGLDVVLLLLLLLWRWGLGGVPGPFWSLPFLLLPWLWPTVDPPPHGQFDLIMFDVGQGQMTALRTRHHLVLYDTGPRWLARSPVSAIFAPWAEHKRLRPDLVFVSHGDDDHDGGLTDVRRLWPDVPVFGGEPARTGTRPCLAGQRWLLDGVALRVLWPAPLPLEHGNNHSCVVRVEGEAGSALLTGDIERPVEFLLAQWALSASQGDTPVQTLRSDLLQVPHHGSGTSSSYALLRAVGPDAATVGAGYLNRFAHPAPSIRERYHDLGIPLHNTADTGMQQWRFRAEKHAHPLCWRHRSRWPWRLPAPVIE